MGDKNSMCHYILQDKLNIFQQLFMEYKICTYYTRYDSSS